MNKISIFSLLTAIALSSAGCSSLKLPYNANSETEVATKASSSKSEKKNKNNNNNNNNNNDNAIPSDREMLLSSRQEKTYTVKDLEEGVVTGDWTIEEVNGQHAVGETTPFLKMVPAQKRVYGNNGCNTINASYIYNQAEKQISFNDVVSTMRMCGTPGITDVEINHALNETRTYSWDHNGDEYYLYFYNSAGKLVMKLMHQNFDFLNGAWQITKIEKDPVNDDDMNIVIDIDQGVIHGNTGCNIFNGVIDIDMETVNTINFHDIITTRMACPNPENQTRLIVGLEDAAHAKPLDGNTVELLNLLRQPVLTLKRINL